MKLKEAKRVLKEWRKDIKIHPLHKIEIAIGIVLKGLKKYKRANKEVSQFICKKMLGEVKYGLDLADGKSYYSRSLINGKEIHKEKYTKLVDDCIEIRFDESTYNEKYYNFIESDFEQLIEYSLTCSPNNVRQGMISDWSKINGIGGYTYYIITIKLIDNETN